MTEKRYKIDLTHSPLLSYIDMVTGEKYPITEDGIYSICDLLNELHEENIQLKGEVAHYKLILMSLKKEAKRLSQIR